MKIVRQNVGLLSHNLPSEKFIEQVARTCYKSEDKITENSAAGLVNGLIRSKHYAMLEHEYIYIKVDANAYVNIIDDIPPQYLKFLNFDLPYISGSIRAWMELFENIKDETDLTTDVTGELFYQLSLKYPLFFVMVDRPVINYGIEIVTREEIEDINRGFDNPSPLLPHTIRFTTNRGISHELCRHRPIAIAQESQRYVAYDKDKFSGQITVIEPLIDPANIETYNAWHYAVVMAETQYMNLRKAGVKPEIARGVLPNDCKTEIVITATETEWQHILNLRMHGTTGAPHPQMKQLMELTYPILVAESEERLK